MIFETYYSQDNFLKNIISYIKNITKYSTHVECMILNLKSDKRYSLSVSFFEADFTLIFKDRDSASYISKADIAINKLIDYFTDSISGYLVFPFLECAVSREVADAFYDSKSSESMTLLGGHIGFTNTSRINEITNSDRYFNIEYSKFLRYTKEWLDFSKTIRPDSIPKKFDGDVLKYLEYALKRDHREDLLINLLI